MSTDGVLVVTAAALVGCGVFLMLERSLSRVLLGLLLLSNGVNVVLLASGGAAGGAPIVGRTPVGDMSDPLPQALVLTAIVITLATTAFVLAMAYRSWQLNGNDDVQDDVEDAVIRRLAEQQEASDSYDLGEADDRDDRLDPEQVSEETA
jgi:multicomponent Na+:H+ antiporter subunit C